MAHPLVKLEALSFNTLERFVGFSKTETEKVQPYYKAFNGDYWQNSKGFLAPTIEASAMTVFENRFVSRNTVQEVVSRVSDAFFKSPNWYISKKGQKVDKSQPDANIDEPTKALIEKIDKILNNFWTTQKLEQKLQQALNSRLVAGRGGLRVYIPVSQQNKISNLTLEEIETAFSAIRVEFVEPDNAIVLEDDGDKFSIVKYEKIENYESQETVKIIEFSFVDDNGKTFIGVVTDKDTSTFNIIDLASTKLDERDPEKKDISNALDLGKETSFYEISGDTLITPQVMQLASLLNLALTLTGIAIFESGFQEIITTNTQFEFTEVPDSSKPGKKRKVPIGLKRGGGAVQNFVGITKVNLETGVKDFAQPQITVKDPVPLENFKVAKDLAYEAILEEVSQNYIQISGDAAASGVSRVQAMNAFYLKIKKYKPDVDAIGSWLLTSILRLLSLSKNIDLSEYSVMLDSQIDIGQLTSEEKKFVIQMLKEGIISMETARVLLKVDNPTLEQMLIDEEQKVAFAKKLSETDALNKLNSDLQPPVQ